MAGAVGAGELGNAAIRHGYQRFDTGAMLAVIAMMNLVQWTGDLAVGRLEAR